MNRYTYNFKSVCPVNQQEIEYRLVIDTKEKILVEDLKEHLIKHHAESYHEEIADDLVCSFPGKQYLCAIHHGVLIETWRN